MKTPRIISTIAALTALSALAAACSSKATAPAPTEVVLVAYDAFTPEEGIFNDFTKDTGVTVKVVTAGDTGTMVSKAILTAGNPEGDVMWGIDNTFLSRAQEANVLTDYTPVDEGDICVNYDKNWFASRNIPVPTSFEDLAKPTYKNLLVVQDPTTSSPGLGFLLGTLAHFGEEKWRNYWTALTQNNVKVVSDWTSAYTVEFSGSSGKGKYPLVVSYGSSPPAEVLYSATPIDTPPTGVIEKTCFRQTEYVGVLRGTKNEAIAQKLVDFLLDTKFQESMPLTLFVFPVNPNAQLPKLFTDFAVRPKTPLTISPIEIEENRDTWIDSWRSLVLR
ncbi:MAG: thiamine ABC transporter substrate-binding protein [Ilumatobacteraceae bacterium]|jgi:thiamine transport system substrate-binding protein|nr:thiamine ABC transporter substrate-binding protein [Ilumatobacteraceae bacterium]